MSNEQHRLHTELGSAAKHFHANHPIHHSPCHTHSHAHACKHIIHIRPHANMLAYLFTELKRAACMMNGFLRKLSSSLSSALFFPVFPTRPSSSSLSASAFVFWKSPCSLVFHKSLQGSSFYPLDRLSEKHTAVHSFITNLWNIRVWLWLDHGAEVRKSAHLKSAHTEVGQQKPSFRTERGLNNQINRKVKCIKTVNRFKTLTACDWGELIE